MTVRENPSSREFSDERKPEAVGDMFSRIAPRYDMMNSIMTLGFDAIWRARLAKAACAALPQDGARVLDIACGSGESVFALERRMSEKGLKAAEIVGADFSEGMLALARGKAEKKRAESSVTKNFARADCAALPFPDETFDAVTTAFGFRNFSDRQKCLEELCRVLKPGGRIFILEVSRAPRLLRGMQDFLMAYAIPPVARLLGCDADSYKYLARTTRDFPTREKLCEQINSAGFSGAKSRPMAFGAVALTSAEKKMPA